MAIDQGESVIAVMGATGSGKTTFVNLVSGSKLRVGEGLESCTSEVQTAVPFQLDGRSVRLVDTPGFDDNIKSDTDILKMIIEYLSTSYKQGSRLSGVIYMHRISDFRMGGIARRNFVIFRQLCGDTTLGNVAIVTNMWGEVNREVGEGRETTLAGNANFFKPALDKQARMFRHHNTLESARDILRQLIHNRPLALRIQQEIVDEHKDISQTGAAAALEQQLREKERQHKEEMQRLQEQAEAKAEMERQEMRRRAAEEERVLQAERLRVQMEAQAWEMEQARLRQAWEMEQERLRQAAEAMRLEAVRVEVERQRQVRELQEHLQREVDAARAEQDRINQLAAELHNRPAVVHEHHGGCIIC